MIREPSAPNSRGLAGGNRAVTSHVSACSGGVRREGGGGGRGHIFPASSKVIEHRPRLAQPVAADPREGVDNVRDQLRQQCLWGQAVVD